MVTKQGSLELLKDPIAQHLLTSTTPARLAYVGQDGLPRVVPIWFHWNRDELVVSSPPKSPKVRALAARPHVALTIDTSSEPYRSLQIRGTAAVQKEKGIPPEYAMAAERYYGVEQGKAWVAQVSALFDEFARITITPQWVSLMDFETRFPNAFELAMAAG